MVFTGDNFDLATVLTVLYFRNYPDLGIEDISATDFAERFFGYREQIQDVIDRYAELRKQGKSSADFY